MLAHELAHLRRCDHWVRGVELIALVLFWWHPVAWWASARLRRAEERCCDLLVTGALPEHRRAYADGLLKTLEYLSRTRALAWTPASGVGTSDLEERLMSIMTRGLPRRLSTPHRLWLGVTALALLLVFPTLAQRGPEHFSGEPIDLALREVPLGDVLRKLAEEQELNFIVQPGIDLEQPVTASFEHTPWDEVLALLLERRGLDYSHEGNVVLTFPAGSLPVPARPFVGAPIDMSLRDADLRETLNGLSRVGELEILLEPEVEGTVTIELENVPWDQALDALLRLHRLEGVREGDRVRVRPAG